MIVFDFTLTNFILSDVGIIFDNFKLIDFVYVQNTGAAFSTFQHSTLMLISVSIIAMLMLLYITFKGIERYALMFNFYMAILIAGIFCNTYERITLGFVRDFINLKFIEFPVFNISDILINIGVFALMFLIITKKYLKNDK